MWEDNNELSLLICDSKDYLREAEKRYGGKEKYEGMTSAPETSLMKTVEHYFSGS